MTFTPQLHHNEGQRGGPHRRGQIRLPHQVGVDRVRRAAAFGDRPHDQRRAAMGVTADEYARRGGLPVGPARQRAAAVEFQAEPVQ